MRKRRWADNIGFLISSVSLCVLLCTAAAAAVTFTPNAAGDADTIYVAGNPAWYPVEYYDQDAEVYAGILPELLELVGHETGLEFTYIQAGPKDQRQRLAKNGQVELVSGCSSDEPWITDTGIHVSEPIFSIPTNNGEVSVCFAFTQIADETLVRKIEEAVSTLSPQAVSRISVQLLMEYPEKIDWPIVAVCIGTVLILLALTIVLWVRLRRCKMRTKQDTQVDLLTGIGNKTYFTEFFDTFISDQYRNLYCVVYIGFDISKVNQYYGTAASEDQLRFAANELDLSTRDNEASARVSGGGFAIAHSSSAEQEIQTWIKQLLSRLNQYTERYGKGYRPYFRAGIYLLESEDRDCETALFHARQGYQQAVEKNLPWYIMHTEHLAQESERIQLKKQTLNALQNGEFLMFLQFIVNGKDGSICGAEAISRWDHPQKGLLYPGSYIDLMESERTIVELDFYIFEEACRQLEQWQAENRNLILSCNFSRITIGRETFVQRIQEIGKRYSFDRKYLIMEITEIAMESSKKVAFDNLSRCKEMGYRIALDDAGSGYTSFADLRDYPIDVVKIDRSILNAAVTTRGAALLRGIASLVHNLGMAVLCEGAETKDQAALLREIGCDYIQGYYFYRPLPLKEAMSVLNEEKSSAD